MRGNIIEYKNIHLTTVEKLWMSPFTSESISFHHCLITRSIIVFIQETSQWVFFVKEIGELSINFKTPQWDIVLIAIIFYFWIGLVGFGQLTGCQCTQHAQNSVRVLKLNEALSHIHNTLILRHQIPDLKEVTQPGMAVILHTPSQISSTLLKQFRWIFNALKRSHTQPGMGAVKPPYPK